MSNRAIPIPQSVPREQQITDASYYVQRMSQEKERLGQLLHEESMIAQKAVEEHLQFSQAGAQYCQTEQQKFLQIVAGLRRLPGEYGRKQSEGAGES